ncbi:Ribosomal-protein-S18p-alanine acetyltransferase [Candidatus Rhodobacter oscarellae]|uniref:Ribosomal-protein-S18p-alanine acetyltransferase n=1 Tax=Candidatus Rhodobacter oscarellae TaxID=1675527 RepID=A0A0J9E7N3_9RHOB|nr:GNAT family N-acetyltransferase [Candidatus Rhodobacter lobularis]KMW58727.1 Ribosomal-protein-S18p-alanine acetyltransferase [Candidatus Rhodobacter lobularis]
MTPEELAALHARCFTVPRPFTALEFADLLAGPTVFLCTIQDGFALGRAVAGEAELVTIAVDPDARRAGRGRALLETFAAEARRREAQAVFLEVDEANAAAIALYQQDGFARIGTRPRYYKHPNGELSNAVVMRRAL